MLSYKRLLLSLLFAALLPVYAFAGPEGAEGEIRPQKPITITSNTMEADRTGRLVVFRGDVVAKEDFTLYCDELRIRYNEAQEIKEIVAKGNVKIVQQDRTATSERAVYDRKKRTIVLTGRPEVYRCGDRVSGRKITVYLDTENAFVEGDGGERVRAVINPDKKCASSASPES